MTVSLFGVVADVPPSTFQCCGRKGGQGENDDSNRQDRQVFFLGAFVDIGQEATSENSRPATIDTRKGKTWGWGH